MKGGQFYKNNQKLIWWLISMSNLLCSKEIEFGNYCFSTSGHTFSRIHASLHQSPKHIYPSFSSLFIQILSPNSWPNHLFGILHNSAFWDIHCLLMKAFTVYEDSWCNFSFICPTSPKNVAFPLFSINYRIKINICWVLSMGQLNNSHI